MHNREDDSRKYKIVKPIRYITDAISSISIRSFLKGASNDDNFPNKIKIRIKINGNIPENIEVIINKR